VSEHGSLGRGVKAERRDGVTDFRARREERDRSAKLAERWTKLASLELRDRVRSLVQQIQIGEAQILVWLGRMRPAPSLNHGRRATEEERQMTTRPKRKAPAKPAAPAKQEAASI
jgi:hypothetical protein